MCLGVGYFYCFKYEQCLGSRVVLSYEIRYHLLAEPAHTEPETGFSAKAGMS